MQTRNGTNYQHYTNSAMMVTRWRTSQTCLLTQLCFYLLVVFIASFLRFNWFNVNSSSTRFCWFTYV